MESPRTIADGCLSASFLTSREEDVLRCVCRGMTDKEIAAELAISRDTVRKFVGNLLRKTLTTNRTELAMWAVRVRFFVP